MKQQEESGEMGCRGRDGVGWRAEKGRGELKSHVQVCRNYDDIL